MSTRVDYPDGDYTIVFGSSAGAWRQSLMLTIRETVPFVIAEFGIGLFADYLAVLSWRAGEAVVALLFAGIAALGFTLGVLMLRETDE